MKLISAKEAKEMVESTLNNDLEPIMAQIEVAAKSGKKVLHIYNPLSKQVLDTLKDLGYDILPLKVRSALMDEGMEVDFAKGLRTTLRLGDSCLILGEIRGKEAVVLYEAMRVGAMSNVVTGTIHADSAYGVYDRVVNDLGVPPTSFKATDIIVVCNPIKSADGLHSWRRVLQISEVRKHWEKDPLIEKGFVDLMRYNVEKDELEPTEDLINGDSEIVKDIASKVKGWAGNWDAVYDNILLRAEIKKELVDVAKETGKPQILEAEFNTLANYVFHKISELFYFPAYSINHLHPLNHYNCPQHSVV